MTTLVKVCGIRSIAEGRAALEAGADWLGFVFWTPSKRFVAPDAAARIIAALRQDALEWSAVGVFVDPQPADVARASNVCGLDYVQLSGNEPADLVAAMPRPTVKAIHVRSGFEADAADIVTSNALGAQTYLLDTHAERLPGGTGRSFNWDALRGVGPRCLVAGGLRADNVAAALTALTPLGVDVSSGVEFPSGGKDPQLIRAFLAAVRSFDAHTTARGGAVS
jgi:phosphoribosylanthranilate isomerase